MPKYQLFAFQSVNLNESKQLFVFDTVNCFIPIHVQSPSSCAHGYGCDQNMWRLTVPAFKEKYQFVTFDHLGSERSEIPQFDRRKYSTLEGYAGDMVAITEALNVGPVSLLPQDVLL